MNRACNIGKRQVAGNGVNSQDQLLSQSTDDQEDYSWVFIFLILSASLMDGIELIRDFPFSRRFACRHAPNQSITHFYEYVAHYYLLSAFS